MTTSQLRENVYRILDEVLETGVPVEIERKGRRVRIVPVESPSRLGRLQPRPDFVVGDPEELVHLDWSTEWKP
jgi:antitoxin (DNA-binding transcriptional repressor) of toxin-antitoxin stability system